jgi:hypothetical protein
LACFLTESPWPEPNHVGVDGSGTRVNTRYERRSTGVKTRRGVKHVMANKRPRYGRTSRRRAMIKVRMYIQRTFIRLLLQRKFRCLLGEHRRGYRPQRRIARAQSQLQHLQPADERTSKRLLGNDTQRGISETSNAQDTDMHKSTTLQAAAVPPKDYRAVQEKIPVLEISSYSLKKKWFQVLRH